MLSQAEIAMKRSRNKYGAVQFWYSPSTLQSYSFKAVPDALRFDSRWEWQVYMTITSQVPKEWISLHQKVEMKPKTKLYRALFLNIDFVVNFPSPSERKPLYIEAKGVRTDAFKRNLLLLEYFNPEVFQRFVVVGDHKPEKVDSVVTTITLIQLVDLVRAQLR